MNEKLIVQLKQETAEKRTELYWTIKALVRDLNHVLQRMDEEPEFAPNNLGIVQGSGGKVDVLCGEYALLKRYSDKV